MRRSHSDLGLLLSVLQPETEGEEAAASTEAAGAAGGRGRRGARRWQEAHPDRAGAELTEAGSGL